MCQWPGEVVKGKKMPGHFGTDRRTVQNLKVVKIIPEKNLILVKGSVPGATGSMVMVRKAIKTAKTA
jgi:large subunit ribosomal protein L3